MPEMGSWPEDAIQFHVSPFSSLLVEQQAFCRALQVSISSIWAVEEWVERDREGEGEKSCCCCCPCPPEEECKPFRFNNNRGLGKGKANHEDITCDDESVSNGVIACEGRRANGVQQRLNKENFEEREKHSSAAHLPSKLDSKPPSFRAGLLAASVVSPPSTRLRKV